MSQYSSRIPDVAKRYDVCPATIYNWIKQGKLRAVKVGSSTRVLSSDLEAFERNFKSVGEKADA